MVSRLPRRLLLLFPLVALALGLAVRSVYAAPFLVKDLDEGAYDSSFWAMKTVGDTAYFSVFTYSWGQTLWRSDGTAAGTVQLIPDPYGSAPVTMVTSVGDVLFFTRVSAGGRLEMWRTDGTPGGTARLAVLMRAVPFDDDEQVRVFASEEVNGRLFFAACEWSRSCALWVTDGTIAGTTHLTDFNPDVDSDDDDWTYPELWSAGHTLYFIVGDSSGGSVPWQSDGTPAGTIAAPGPVPIFSPSITPDPGPDVTFFAASTPATGWELWKYDRTSDTSALVADVNPGPANSLPDNFQYVASGVLFTAVDATGAWELWRSDGSSAGTTQLTHFAAAGRLPNEFDWGFTAVHGTIFFSGYGADGALELWKTDGSADGSVRVAQIPRAPASSSPTGLTALSGNLFFNAAGGFWKSDGTEAGTVRLATTILTYEGFPHPVAVGNQIFFPGTDDAAGAELWRTDGTPAGTMRVADIRPGPESSQIADLMNVGDTVYFVAENGSLPRSLWRSDGTAAGTVPVGEVSRVLGAVGDTILSWSDYPDGLTLWKSDTHGPHQTLVERLYSEFYSSIGPHAVVGGTLVFSAYRGQQSGAPAEDLWTSDGTPSGTVLITHLPGAVASLIGDGDGGVYFTIGEELWKSTGTAVGTTQVGAVGPGARVLATVAGGLLVASKDPDGGFAIWSSDGASAEMTRLAVAAGPLPSAGDVVVVNDTLYFPAGDAAHNVELWGLRLHDPSPPLASCAGERVPRRISRRLAHAGRLVAAPGHRAPSTRGLRHARRLLRITAARVTRVVGRGRLSTDCGTSLSTTIADLRARSRAH